MAHELAHVRHRDILISTLSATVAGAISTLANFGMLFGGHRDEEGGGGNPILAILVLVLAPIAAMLIQFAISRTREFGADRGGAEISGDPRALADALAKIDAYARGVPLAAAEAQPRDRADDDRQPAFRGRHQGPLQHAPVDRGTHHAPARDGVGPVPLQVRRRPTTGSRYTPRRRDAVATAIRSPRRREPGRRTRARRRQPERRARRSGARGRAPGSAGPGVRDAPRLRGAASAARRARSKGDFRSRRPRVAAVRASRAAPRAPRPAHRRRRGGHRLREARPRRRARGS